MINARCHSDDHAIEVKFDAEAFFAQATDTAVLDLARCGFGGDYPADEVALFVANVNPKVEEVFTYVNVARNVKDVGFECYVDQTSLMEWVKQNRPHLVSEINKIVNE